MNQADKGLLPTSVINVFDLKSECRQKGGIGTSRYEFCAGFGLNDSLIKGWNSLGVTRPERLG
jgi:hypothetical protein